MINKTNKLSLKPNNVYVFFTLFYAYFVLALFDTAKGNFIPYFINDFSINNSTIGLILSINQLGSVFGAFLAGHVSQRYGLKVTFIIGTAICSIVGFSSLLLSNAILLGIFFFVFNFGRSFLCISVDSLVPINAIGFEVLFINLTHFMFGVGSFTGQSIYGNLLFNNINWKTIYFVLGFLFTLCMIFVMFIKVPKSKHILENKPYNKKDLYRNPLLKLFIICFSGIVAAESIVMTWYINYMSSNYNFTAVETAKFSAIFFMAFSLGRLVGGFIFHKIGESKGLKISMGMFILCIIVGLILRKNGLYIIAISGLFISVTYPTLVVLINSAFKELSSLALGVINTFSSIAGIVSSILIGLLNDLIGSYTTFYLGAVFMAISLAMLIAIDRRQSLENR